MTVQLKYHQKNTAVLKYTLPNSQFDEKQDILFLAKCGIFRLMDEDHPSLSELYKIRYNEHGGLQLNGYQKILKKRLTSLIKEIKEHEDLRLHILIPPYQGNYIKFCVMISSLKPFTKTTSGKARVFSSYDNFAVQNTDLKTLHLNQMKDTELQNLFRIACSEKNNGDYVFNLSINANGIPDLLYEEYNVELGIHEIEVLQNIVNSQVKYYDLPLIQLNNRYARMIGWDMNDKIISITEPRTITTFGNERVMVQALRLLQSFHLKHQIRNIEIINPRNGNRSMKPELYLKNENNYLIITTKADQWEKALALHTQQTDGKYYKHIPTNFHKQSELGIDLIQLFHKNKNLLVKIIRSWANITSSEQSAGYEFESLMELFDDLFKIYSQEQLSELQLRMLLKDSTLNDIFRQDQQNNLISKYEPIFNNPFYNFKQKFELGSDNTERRLWKSDFLDAGIHVIDISSATQFDQLVLQSFFLILQENHFQKNMWTLHSFGEGLRHSYEKVEQIIKEINLCKSILHFTHTTEMPSFLKNNDLMLFDKNFSTYSVLKTFDATTLFEDTGNASLLVYEQTNITLLKPIEYQMLDLLYDRNVLVKLSPDDTVYPHDLTPAKQAEMPVLTPIDDEVVDDEDLEEETVFSQPFAEEEDNINEEYAEDSYIGPDLLFKVPVMASFRNYRQYHFQDIEFASNLPRDVVEKQLQHLLTLKWIETTVYDKKDVYLPLKKGMGYVDDLMLQVKDIKEVQEEIFDIVFTELDVSPDEKIINKGNIVEVLLALRLSYHNLTEVEDRRRILLRLCSVCKYVSDGFGEDDFWDYNDELVAYYYWSLGVFAAFEGAQLGSKRDEHLLIRKITEITKAIADLITDKLQHEFSMKQTETGSDESFVYSESIKNDEKEDQTVDEIKTQSEIKKEKIKTVDTSLKIDPTIDHTTDQAIEKQVEKRDVEKIKSTPTVLSIPRSPPTTHNIPKSIDKSTPSKPLLKRQLTPQELKPIVLSPGLYPWYKYHRKDYEQTISSDPLNLGSDDIIFAFMVNSMLGSSSRSVSVKKRKHSLMFLNREQMKETVKRSPLPLEVNYDNLVNSEIIEQIDVGYNILDVRTVLSLPDVSVDPMYKRMSLGEVISLIDESPLNFIQSKTLLSYIYADYYDIELQPVVAICYSILIDKREMKDKYKDYLKFVPWAYTMIKLFMMKKRNFIRSNELDYLPDSFITELKSIRVGSTLELLEYTGDNEIAIKLKFLIQHRIKKLGLAIRDIDSYSRSDGIMDDQSTDQTPDRILDEESSEKRKRISFSPTLIQQLEQDGLDDTTESSPSEKPLKVNKKTITWNKQPTKPSKKSKKSKNSKNSKKTGEVVSSKNEKLSSFTEENISLENSLITSIDEICDEAMKKADTTSPTDLLGSIFSNVIYPGIIGVKSEISDLHLIELFNEVGELTGVSNTVDFSRNLGDMQGRWEEFTDTRERIIKSFVRRIKETSSNFVYNELFRELLRNKINRKIE